VGNAEEIERGITAFAREPNGRLIVLTAVLIAASAVLDLAAGAGAQSVAEIAKQFAPNGKLRVGVLMLSFSRSSRTGNSRAGAPISASRLQFKSFKSPVDPCPSANLSRLVACQKPNYAGDWM
jgi:hypothetical protein